MLDLDHLIFCQCLYLVKPRSPILCLLEFQWACYRARSGPGTTRPGPESSRVSLLDPEPTRLWACPGTGSGPGIFARPRPYPLAKRVGSEYLGFYICFYTNFFFYHGVSERVLVRSRSGYISMVLGPYRYYARVWFLDPGTSHSWLGRVRGQAAYQVFVAVLCSILHFLGKHHILTFDIACISLFWWVYKYTFFLLKPPSFLLFHFISVVLSFLTHFTLINLDNVCVLVKHCYIYVSF